MPAKTRVDSVVVAAASRRAAASRSPARVAIVGAGATGEQIMGMITPVIPSAQFEHFSQDQAVRDLLEKDFRLVVVDMRLGDAPALKHAGELARKATIQKVPTLFVAHDERAYRRLSGTTLKPSPTVGVALGSTEIGTMASLLYGRVERAKAAKKSRLPSVPRMNPHRGSATAHPPVTLENHPLLKSATSFLRNPNSGRLDVRRIAQLYGEPLNRFAEALDVSPAAVSQTPDSKAYQDLLGYFERVAQIIPMLDSKNSFGPWTKAPNQELKGEAPIAWLFGGEKKARRLAEVVEDVLVGQPD